MNYPLRTLLPLSWRCQAESDGVDGKEIDTFLESIYSQSQAHAISKPVYSCETYTATQPLSWVVKVHDQSTCLEVQTATQQTLTESKGL